MLHGNSRKDMVRKAILIEEPLLLGGKYLNEAISPHSLPTLPKTKRYAGQLQLQRDVRQGLWIEWLFPAILSLYR